MTFEDLVPLLKSNHFYPKIVKEIGMEKDTVVGLEVYCSPLMNVESLERVREVVGGEFRCTWMPNQGYILIDKV